MRAKVYEGYFSKGQFYSTGQQIIIPENRKVCLMIFDEPTKAVESDPSDRRDDDSLYMGNLYRGLFDHMDDQLEIHPPPPSLF